MALTQYYVDYGAGNDTTGNGTIGTPWKTIQKALDTVTRDATNGDQVNVKSGTAQVLAAALTLATYGTPSSTAPLVIRGFTSAANDGGMAEIDCGGFTFWTTNYSYFALIDLEMHTFGNNNGVNLGNSNPTLLARCEVHKGASSPSSKYLVNSANAHGQIFGCYIHDAGTTGIGIYSNGASRIVGNYVENCPTGITGLIVVGNIIKTATNGVGILSGAVIGGLHWGNTIYSASGGTGIGANFSGAHYFNVFANNAVEGFSGTGGKGLSTAADMAIVGANAYYNCATPETFGGDVLLNLGNADTLGASPFVDGANGDYDISGTVAGVTEDGWPQSWPGLTTNTAPKPDKGAVQAGAGGGGGGGVVRRVMRTLGA